MPTRESISGAYGTGRVTVQREAVTEAVERVGRAFTIEELAEEVERVGDGCGTATVYRAVAALEESGWLARLGERDGHALYARCTRTDHHHHMVCIGCGSVSHAECPIDKSALKKAGKQGFEVTHHEITLWGMCAKCRSTTERED